MHTTMLIAHIKYIQDIQNIHPFFCVHCCIHARIYSMYVLCCIYIYVCMYVCMCMYVMLSAVTALVRGRLPPALPCEMAEEVRLRAGRLAAARGEAADLTRRDCIATHVCTTFLNISAPLCMHVCMYGYSAVAWISGGPLSRRSPPVPQRAGAAAQQVRSSYVSMDGLSSPLPLAVPTYPAIITSIISHSVQAAAGSGSGSFLSVLKAAYTGGGDTLGRAASLITTY